MGSSGVVWGVLGGSWGGFGCLVAILVRFLMVFEMALGWCWGALGCFGRGKDPRGRLEDPARASEGSIEAILGNTRCLESSGKPRLRTVLAPLQASLSLLPARVAI